MAKERKLSVEGFDYLIEEGDEVVGLICRNESHMPLILKDEDSSCDFLSIFFSPEKEIGQDHSPTASQSSGEVSLSQKLKGGLKQS